MPELIVVSTAVPRWRVDARQTVEQIPRVAAPDQVPKFTRVVEASRIEQRHAAIPMEELFSIVEPAARNEKYIEVAIPLAEQVTRAALDGAGIDGAAIDAVIAVSCTGYLQPSVDAYLSNKLGINPLARRIPISQLGCGAGGSALGLGAELLCGKESGYVLLLSVELCSLLLQVRDPTDADIVGGILFGDGAAAAILSASESGRGPRTVATRSVLLRDSIDALGLYLTNTGLRLTLSSRLPILLRNELRDMVNAFLHENSLSFNDLQFFAVHPGGPRILDVVADSLGIPQSALEPSWNVLKRYGNMSSATIFFVLQEIQATRPPPNGAFGLAVTFGTGVTCELVLLQWAPLVTTAEHRVE